jgi:hypothetical protein
MELNILPQGCQMVRIFSNQKYLNGEIFEGLGMEKVGIFWCRLEYITAMWYALWSFGNVAVI